MRTKIWFGAAVFVAFAGAVALIVAGLVFYQSSSAGGSNSPDFLGEATAFSIVEVERHASQESCWVIINQKVYDVTGLIARHPGGSEAIIKNCGKDGTQDFETKGQNPPMPHSAGAESMLQSYYIGDLTLEGSNYEPDLISQAMDVLTVDEISKHSIANDCWMIISNKVYDVTSYIGSHPGGSQAIVKNCGRDGTQDFQTKGKPGGSPHPSSAQALLSQYYIGDLNQERRASVQSANNSYSNAERFDDEDDYEDEDEDEDEDD